MLDGPPPEYPATIDDLAELNGIEFTPPGGVPACLPPGDIEICLPDTVITIVESYLEEGDSFTAEDNGDICMIGENSPWAGYVCSNLEQSSSVYAPTFSVFLCTSANGYRVIIARVVSNGLIKYGSVGLGYGKQICDGFEQYVPFDNSCDMGPYNSPPCWDMTGITVRMHSGF